MEKNTGTITIVIFLTLIFCILVGALVFGWFGFKDLKKEEEKPTSPDKKTEPTKANAATPPLLRKDEVDCDLASSVLAHRFSVDPDALVTILETGRIWTIAAKEASMLYFKKTIDDDARRYGESIRWEVFTSDELRFVVRLGSGLAIALEGMMQQNGIEYKKTCLEKFGRTWTFFGRQPPPPRPTAPRPTTTQQPTTTTTTGGIIPTRNTTGINENKPLLFGDSGDEVRELQILINKIAARRGTTLCSVTANFDEQTDAIVSSYLGSIQPHLTLAIAKTYAKTIYKIE